MTDIVTQMQSSASSARVDAWRSYRQVLRRAAAGKSEPSDAALLGELVRELGLGPERARMDAQKIGEFLDAEGALNSIDQDGVLARRDAIARKYKAHRTRVAEREALDAEALKKIEDEDAAFAPEWYGLQDAKKRLERARADARDLVSE